MLYRCFGDCQAPKLFETSLPDAPADPSRKVEDDTIIFTDVQTGSSAVYQCNVSNDYGYLLSNAFVNVLCEFDTRKPHLDHGGVLRSR